MPAGIYADLMERGKKIEEMARAMSGIMYCDCELIDHNAANWEDVEKVVSVQMTNLIDAIRIQLNELEHWFERGCCETVSNPEELKGMKLIPKWCDCQNPTFLCYPEDGVCTCGIDHHHVHCECGKIMQMG